MDLNLTSFVDELSKIAVLSEQRKAELLANRPQGDVSLHHGALPAAGLAVAAPLAGLAAKSTIAPALVRSMKETGSKMTAQQYNKLRRSMGAEDVKWYRTPEHTPKIKIPKFSFNFGFRPRSPGASRPHFPNLPNLPTMPVGPAAPSAARLSVAERAAGGVSIPQGGVPGVFQETVAKTLHHRTGMSIEAARKMAREGGVAGAASTPEIVAHELGHSSLYKNPLMNKLRWLKGPLIPLAGLTAVGMSALPESDQSTAVKAAPLVAAGGFLPTLADEAQASIRGMKHLRGAAKYSPAAIRAMRMNLLKAFGTYGSVAAATTLPIAAYSLYRAHRGDK